MELTFDEAVENHRKMWNWIADKTKKRKRIVHERDYFTENNISNACYCCEYGAQQVGSYHGRAKCEKCPINWGVKYCTWDSVYDIWRRYVYLRDWQSAAKYARQIANLSARQEKIEC